MPVRERVGFDVADTPVGVGVTVGDKIVDVDLDPDEVAPDVCDCDRLAVAAALELALTVTLALAETAVKVSISATTARKFGMLTAAPAPLPRKSLSTEYVMRCARLAHISRARGSGDLGSSGTRRARAGRGDAGQHSNVRSITDGADATASKQPATAPPQPRHARLLRGAGMDSRTPDAGTPPRSNGERSAIMESAVGGSVEGGAAGVPPGAGSYWPRPVCIGWPVEVEPCQSGPLPA